MRPCKNSMVSFKNETVVLRMIYKSTLKCSNDSSPLWRYCSSFLTFTTFLFHSVSLPNHYIHHSDLLLLSPLDTYICCVVSAHSLDPFLWGGSPIIPLLDHQSAYLSIWPATPSLQRGLSKNPGVPVWCVFGFS